VVLGSWWALFVFASYPAIIVVRLKDEEALLEKELAGYCDYQKKVRWRLVPFVW
jgi:protein-S-isoprenylcysteine O-methyltransferase Ste14